MFETIRVTLGEMFESKKFIASVAALIAVVGAKICGKFGFVFDPATANELATIICVGASSYVVAQGIADHGKSAAQINADAAEDKKDAPTS